MLITLKHSSRLLPHALEKPLFIFIVSTESLDSKTVSEAGYDALSERFGDFDRYIYPRLWSTTVVMSGL